MAIAAKRFSFLDKETNLGVADYYKTVSSEIQNIDFPDVSSLKGKMDDLIKESGINDILGKINLNTSDIPSIASRVTKDLISSKFDFKKAGTSAMDAITAKVLGKNPAIASMIRQIPNDCKDELLGKPGSRRKSKSTISNRGKKRRGRGGNCDIDSFSDMFSKLTGKSFKPTIFDADSIEKMITGIGAQGYKLGLDGVFGDIISGVGDKNTIARAASSLLGDLAGKKDMMAILDVGCNLGGMDICKYIPDISSKIMSGFKVPTEISGFGLSNFMGSVTEGMSNIDKTWKLAEDGIMSAKNLDAIASPDLFKGLQCMASDIPIDVGSMASDFIANTPDIDFLSAGSLFSGGAGIESMMSEFPDLSFA